MSPSSTASTPADLTQTHPNRSSLEGRPMEMPEEHRTALDLDRRALNLIGADIITLDDASMSLATPCGAWTVADLIAHMNTEHAAICGADHHPQADPRTQFTPI